MALPPPPYLPYPESLNISAEKFEGCALENTAGGCADIDSQKDNKKIRKRPRDQCVPTSTVSDDLILLRLSSYLSSNSNGSASPYTDNCDSFSSSCNPEDSVYRNGKVRSVYRKLDGIWADWGKVGTDGIGPILANAGIMEVEALNRSARAGQCQFATVAAALSIDGAQMASDEDGFRPDLELRKLVMHAISHNPECYQHFLVAAGRSTRSSSQEGGTGVNLTQYLRTMSKPSTDGDHVTLQALCDVLKITIRIVKPSLQYSSIPNSPRSYDLGPYDDSSDDCASSLSSNTPYLDPLSLPTGVFPCSSRSIYISEEMKPRRLKVIDDRVRDVQNLVRGRLIWLSHVGDAHFRYLRAVPNPGGFLNQEDLLEINEEYKSAFFLQKERMKLLSSVCLLNDGYTNYLETDPCNLSSGLPFSCEYTKKCVKVKEKKACESNIFDKNPSISKRKLTLKLHLGKLKPEYKGKVVKVKKSKPITAVSNQPPQIYPSVVRALGKRKIRPVIPSNVTRLNWGSRTYDI